LTHVTVGISERSIVYLELVKEERYTCNSWNTKYSSILY